MKRIRKTPVQPSRSWSWSWDSSLSSSWSEYRSWSIGFGLAINEKKAKNRSAKYVLTI